MALEIRQTLKLTQQLIMTPQLQLAIKLLPMSRLELIETIHQEMEVNPALEDYDEEAEETAASTDTDGELETDQAIHAEIQEVTIAEKMREDIDWSNYIEEYNTPGKITLETEKRELPAYDSFVTRRESLPDHLLWQLLMTRPDADTKLIGSLIIGNLSSDGFLELGIEDLAAQAGFAEDRIQEVLLLLQSFDPVGVCARNLQECLLIQTRHFKLDTPLITGIIENHLHHLENRNYKAICKALQIDMADLGVAINIIRNLEPRPGREFSSDEPQYITPDIFVYKIENEFVIVLNDDGMPKLRVNQFFQKAIQNKTLVPANARDYINEKVRSAEWLIKSIHQRQKTIYKVMRSILKFQYDFFEKGIEYLKPMVLKDVAEDIQMHESTISRVTTNKYAHTPQGLFELKYFFNSAISRTNGDAVASASVQNRIKQIIEREDPQNPYSDNQIVELLKESSNIDIARRTVAKYREVLRILPSSKRRQF